MAGITIRERRDGKVVRMQATIYAVPPNSLKAERYRITVPVSVTSKSGAVRWAEAVRRDIEAGKPLPQAREPRAPRAAKIEPTALQVVTLRAAVDTYLADLAGRGAAASTVRTQRQNLKPFVDAHGDLSVAAVGEVEASNVRAQMLDAGYAAGTINAGIDVFQIMLRRCHTLRMRGSVEKIHRLRGRKLRASKAYDDAAFEAMITATPHPVALVVLLLAGEAALRVGEVIGLDVGDVDLVARVLHVRRSVSIRGEVTPPKTGEERTVPLTSRLVAALTPFVDGRPCGAPLLAGASFGGRVSRSGIRHRLGKAQAACGLQAKGPHALRHSAATSALAGGADLVAVQRMLGHARASTTVDMYLHDTGGAAARAVAALERGRAHAATDTDLTRAPKTAPKRRPPSRKK